MKKPNEIISLPILIKSNLEGPAAVRLLDKSWVNDFNLSGEYEWRFDVTGYDFTGKDTAWFVWADDAILHTAAMPSADLAGALAALNSMNAGLFYSYNIGATIYIATRTDVLNAYGMNFFAANSSAPVIIAAAVVLASPYRFLVVQFDKAISNFFPSSLGFSVKVNGADRAILQGGQGTPSPNVLDIQLEVPLPPDSTQVITISYERQPLFDGNRWVDIYDTGNTILLGTDNLKQPVPFVDYPVVNGIPA
jgi:hypothetical protein